MSQEEKDTVVLANYIRTLVPPSTPIFLAIKAFAFCFADAIYQIDKGGVLDMNLRKESLIAIIT